MQGLDSSEQLGMLEIEIEELKNKVQKLEKALKIEKAHKDEIIQSRFRLKALVEFYKTQCYDLWINYVYEPGNE